MNQSVGGGYCDCGDREAWKDSFCCSIHERNAAGGGTSSLLKFPPEIVQRARAVFSAGESAVRHVTAPPACACSRRGAVAWRRRSSGFGKSGPIVMLTRDGTCLAPTFVFVRV